MQPIKNPLEGRGSRNLFCVHYDKCLNQAYIRGWESFNCEGCRAVLADGLDFIKSVEIPVIDQSGLFLDDDQASEMISFNPKDLFFSNYKSGDSENESA